ncbi:MAG: response regulator, partial [Planctomycetota bacterium]
DVPVHDRTQMGTGARIPGPAVITEPTGTTIVEDGWQAEQKPGRALVLTRVVPLDRQEAIGTTVDPIMLEVMGNLFMSIADQMGATLAKTAASVNIRERLDFSCAGTQVEEEHGHDTESHSELVFTVGGDERLALATGLIRRIVQVDPADFERVGGRDHAQVDGVVTEVVRLEDHLPISANTDAADRHHLILPRHVDRPLGLLCTELVDVFDCDFDPHGQGRVGRGVLGTAPLGERLTVFVDLYAVAEMADPASVADRRDAAGDPWGSILLVEDTPFFRNLVAGYLRTSGYRVITAADGRAALEQLERQTVDAVVSDLEMPRMGGLELVAALRSDQRHARLPCAALTSMKDPGVRDRALAAGFDHFEQKLDRRRLLAVVDSMVGVERGAVEVGDGS